MNLCKYSNVFGTPKIGVHSTRIFGMAFNDIIFTIIGAYIISITSKYKFWQVLIILFVLSIILHRLFCVHTVIDKLLFN
jgi:hypothetical protein